MNTGHIDWSPDYKSRGGDPLRFDMKAPPDPLLGLVREARDALAALLIMMDRESKPRKLDEAITWRKNEERARAMGRAAFSRLDAALAEAPKAGEESRAGESA